VSLESLISVSPELWLSPNTSQYYLLRDGDLSRPWSPTSSGLCRQYHGCCFYKCMGFFKHSPTWALRR
jgi:hypothetical protein